MYDENYYEDNQQDTLFGPVVLPYILKKVMWLKHKHRRRAYGYVLAK